MSERFRALFTTKLSELCDKKEVCSSYLTGLEYKTIIERLDALRTNPQMKKVAKDYRILRQYEVVPTEQPDGTIANKLLKPSTQLYYVSNDDLFDAITEIHESTSHGGRDMMYGKARKKYVNMTKEVLLLYADLCEHCHAKRTSNRRPTMERLPVSSVLRRRCQVDVLDMQMQPDGGYRYILCYQDLRTNFICLRALKSEDPGEVADTLIDIFCTFGSPLILQSVNGFEFAREVVSQVKNMWPECVLIVGTSVSPTTGVQDSVGGSQSDVRYALGYWMKENNTGSWYKGLRFIQWKMNSRKDGRGIRKSSYNAMFFEEARLGIQHTSLSKDSGTELLTEDDLVVMMEENKQNMQLLNNPYKKEKMMGKKTQAAVAAVDAAERRNATGSGSDDMASNSGDSDSSKRIDFTTSGNGERTASSTPSPTNIEQVSENGSTGSETPPPVQPVEQNGDQGNGSPPSATFAPIPNNEEMETEEQAPSPSTSNDENGESNSTSSTAASQGSSNAEENEERDRFADSSGSGSDDANSPRSSMHCDAARPFDHMSPMPGNTDGLFCSGCGGKQAVRIMCSNCDGKISPAEGEDEVAPTAKRIKEMEDENEEQLDVGTGKRKRLDESTKRRLTAKWNESSVPSKQICIEDHRMVGAKCGKNAEWKASEEDRACQCKKKKKDKSSEGTKNGGGSSGGGACGSGDSGGGTSNVGGGTCCRCRCKMKK